MEEPIGTAVGAVEQHKLPALTFTPEQVDLIKRTVAKGTTDDELALFLYTARRTGLDPLVKQIHAVKRWSSADNREVMAIQVGIDGFRLIAERTGKYAPGGEPSFVYNDKDGSVVSATAYVKKLAGGQWHVVAATAHYSEYVQKKKTDGSITSMWLKPHIMLGKCAEALALRRAFPAELSGVYTPDVMGQAGPVIDVTDKQKAIPGPQAKKEEPTRESAGANPHPGDVISDPQRKRLYAIQHSKGVTDDNLAGFLQVEYPYVLDAAGKLHTASIRKQDYNAIVAWVEKQEA